MNVNLKAGLFTTLAIGFLIYMISCTQTGNETTQGSVSIKMTDSIAEYHAVNVNIEAIEVHVASADSVEESDSTFEGMENWHVLSTHSGVYNLLDFQNGVDTLIAMGEVPTGMVSQIRLILGPDNTIVTQTDTVDLKVPGGLTSGYKILLNKELKEGENLELLFDFDAGRSIVVRGNGEYLLKPVLHLIK